jgi:hypothetical protein
VILLILEAHGALHFGACVDEGSQRVAWERVVVAAGVDILKFAGFVIASFGIGAIEQEAFDFVRGVERVVLFFVKLVRERLERPADVGFVRRTVFVDDFAEDENLAGTENVSGSPVESAPVDAETQVAFALLTRNFLS